MTTPFPLGRTLEHDERSWNFEHPRKAAPLKTVTHKLTAPPLNQGQLGACEGNTAAEFLNTDAAQRNRLAYWTMAGIPSGLGVKYLKEAEAVRLYGTATALDNDQIPGQYPPNDTGTSGVGIAKAMVKYGAIKRYNWTFTWTSFLAALQTQPIMLGTNWYESMFNTSRAGWVIAPGKDDQPAGGHAYLAFAYDLGRNLVGCTNHWGTDWGTTIGGYKGSFWITRELLQRLLIHEKGDSLVPVLF